MKSVLIIGSGLLGLALAEKFSKQGYQVFITSTTKSKLLILQNKGYKPLLFNSNEIEHYDTFKSLTVDVFIFALSPSKCKAIAYNEVLKNCCNTLQAFKRLVFTSSISVYANNNQCHTEESKAIEFNSMLYQTESYITQHITSYYIFRLAGLIDIQRHPKGFHKALEVKQADALVNLVQIQDVSHIIFDSVTHHINDGVYNVCSPEHPSKKQYYGSFNQDLIFHKGDEGKIIDGDFIAHQLHYSYSSIYDF